MRKWMRMLMVMRVSHSHPMRSQPKREISCTGGTTWVRRRTRSGAHPVSMARNMMVAMHAH
jgi:hypothetical protein